MPGNLANPAHEIADGRLASGFFQDIQGHVLKDLLGHAVISRQRENESQHVVAMFKKLPHQQFLTHESLPDSDSGDITNPHCEAGSPPLDG
jgi:hypothetical protein